MWKPQRILIPRRYHAIPLRCSRQILSILTIGIEWRIADGSTFSLTMCLLKVVRVTKVLGRHLSIAALTLTLTLTLTLILILPITFAVNAGEASASTSRQRTTPPRMMHATAFAAQACFIRM